MAVVLYLLFKTICICASVDVFTNCLPYERIGKGRKDSSILRFPVSKVDRLSRDRHGVDAHWANMHRSRRSFLFGDWQSTLRNDTRNSDDNKHRIPSEGSREELEKLMKNRLINKERQRLADKSSRGIDKHPPAKPPPEYSDFDDKEEEARRKTVGYFDPCKHVECRHGGLCKRNDNSVSGFYCACSFGYRGSTCSLSVSSCELCYRKHDCTVHPDGVFCLCASGNPCLVQVSNKTDFERILSVVPKASVIEGRSLLTGILLVVLFALWCILFHFIRVSITWWKQRDRYVAQHVAPIYGPDFLEISDRLCADSFCCCHNRHPHRQTTADIKRLRAVLKDGNASFNDYFDNFENLSPPSKDPDRETSNLLAGEAESSTASPQSQYENNMSSAVTSSQSSGASPRHMEWSPAARSPKGILTSSRAEGMYQSADERRVDREPYYGNLSYEYEFSQTPPKQSGSFSYGSSKKRLQFADTQVSSPSVGTRHGDEGRFHSSMCRSPTPRPAGYNNACGRNDTPFKGTQPAKSARYTGFKAFNSPTRVGNNDRLNRAVRNYGGISPSIRQIQNKLERLSEGKTDEDDSIIDGTSFDDDYETIYCYKDQYSASRPHQALFSVERAQKKRSQEVVQLESETNSDLTSMEAHKKVSSPFRNQYVPMPGLKPVYEAYSMESEETERQRDSYRPQQYMSADQYLPEDQEFPPFRGLQTYLPSRGVAKSPPREDQLKKIIASKQEQTEICACITNGRHNSGITKEAEYEPPSPLSDDLKYEDTSNVSNNQYFADNIHKGQSDSRFPYKKAKVPTKVRQSPVKTRYRVPNFNKSYNADDNKNMISFDEVKNLNKLTDESTATCKTDDMQASKDGRKHNKPEESTRFECLQLDQWPSSLVQEETECKPEVFTKYSSGKQFSGTQGISKRYKGTKRSIGVDSKTKCSEMSSMSSSKKCCMEGEVIKISRKGIWKKYKDKTKLQNQNVLKQPEPNSCSVYTGAVSPSVHFPDQLGFQGELRYLSEEFENGNGTARVQDWVNDSCDVNPWSNKSGNNNEKVQTEFEAVGNYGEFIAPTAAVDNGCRDIDYCHSLVATPMMELSVDHGKNDGSVHVCSDIQNQANNNSNEQMWNIATSVEPVEYTLNTIQNLLPELPSDEDFEDKATTQHTDRLCSITENNKLEFVDLTNDSYPTNQSDTEINNSSLSEGLPGHISYEKCDIFNTLSASDEELKSYSSTDVSSEYSEVDSEIFIRRKSGVGIDEALCVDSIQSLNDDCLNVVEENIVSSDTEDQYPQTFSMSSCYATKPTVEVESASNADDAFLGATIDDINVSANNANSQDACREIVRDDIVIHADGAIECTEGKSESLNASSLVDNKIILNEDTATVPEISASKESVQVLNTSLLKDNKAVFTKDTARYTLISTANKPGPPMAVDKPDLETGAKPGAIMKHIDDEGIASDDREVQSEDSSVSFYTVDENESLLDMSEDSYKTGSSSIRSDTDNETLVGVEDEMPLMKYE